jgi:simple sugar transport system permease protein
MKIARSASPLNVPYYTQDFVKGAVLVGALAITFGIGARR